MKEQPDEPTPRDPRTLLSTGALLASVAAVLILGAVLHGRVPLPAAELAPPVDRLQAEASEPVDVEDPEAGGLQARASRDRVRIADEARRWTLQLVVACKEEGVARLLGQVSGDAPLFVLPRAVEGRACWAVTWGSFASEADALAATPPSSLPLSEPPRPRPFAAYLS